MKEVKSTPCKADVVLRSTAGRVNFQRLTRLLISGGTRLLRDTFDSVCPPSILPLRLNDPAVYKALKAAKLTKPQWDCLYPSPGVCGKSTDFNITLLSWLLRTICLLSPPPTGWDNLPISTDHSLTADLVRVKFSRISIYGYVNENMEIPDDDFPRLWKEISEVLVRIAGNISMDKRDEWQKAINNFLKDPLTPEVRLEEGISRLLRNTPRSSSSGSLSAGGIVSTEQLGLGDNAGFSKYNITVTGQAVVRDNATAYGIDIGRPTATTSSQVPPEIRARGPRAELAFQKALRNGKVQVYRGRIMLIGQDRAGKTSLKKSLLGLPFDPQEESTVGVEIDPSKFEVDVDQVENWQRTDEKTLGETEYKDGIARVMAVELNRNDTGEEQSSLVGQERTNSNDEQVDPTAGMALEKTSQEEGKSTEQSELTDLQAVIDSAAALPDDVTERVIQYLQRLKLGDGVKAKETILTLWDFAGQHLYYASHSVFLSPRAVYILVYNLSKELSATAEPCVRQGIHEVRLENPNDETNMDCLLSWLVSIHSIQPSTGGEGVKNDPDSGVAKLPYLRPPVLIVGTNADRPFEEAKQMESRVKKSISGKTYEKHVIRPLFSVDNNRAVTNAGLCALRKKIMDVLKQEPYMGEDVPIRWFNFEKVVEALVAKKTFHMNLDQLEDVIRQVCFIQDDDELALMLNFYHDLGVIVKHGRTVVLQAQWLIDLFKKLITVRPFNEADPVRAGYWRELEKTGILRMELVDHVFDDLIQQGLDKQDILDMMELYGLIAKFSPCSTDFQLKYFVPAQLTYSSQNLSEIRPSDSNPCPLYFHFLDGFVPHGLFTQIVSRCIRWCSYHGPELPLKLFHNGARFFLEKQTIYDLIVICRKRFIKIVLNQWETDAPGSSDALAEMASQVRKFLEETLQGLSLNLPWLRHLRYELCVVCPSCLGAEEECLAHKSVSCTHDDCLHLIRILPKGQLICEERFGETPAVCGLETWYKLDPKDPDTVQPQKSLQLDQAPHSVELCNTLEAGASGFPSRETLDPLTNKMRGLELTPANGSASDSVQQESSADGAEQDTSNGKGSQNSRSVPDDCVMRKSVTELPFSILKELGIKLDPLRTSGGDFRDLASEFDCKMDTIWYLQSLKSPSSPTETLIKDNLPFIDELCTKLDKIKRSDAKSSICDWVSSQDCKCSACDSIC